MLLLLTNHYFNLFRSKRGNKIGSEDFLAIRATMTDSFSDFTIIMLLLKEV